jgi:hypothetical protein
VRPTTHEHAFQVSPLLPGDELHDAVGDELAELVLVRNPARLLGRFKTITTKGTGAAQCRLSPPR